MITQASADGVEGFMTLIEREQQVVEAAHVHARLRAEFVTPGIPGGGVADGVGFVRPEGGIHTDLQSIRRTLLMMREVIRRIILVQSARTFCVRRMFLALISGFASMASVCSQITGAVFSLSNSSMPK